MKKVTEETYLAVMEAYNWHCVHCLSKENLQLHHKLSKSKINQQKYPLFIHSPINLVPLCIECHNKYTHLHRITYQQAEMYENFLKNLLDRT